MEQIPYGTDSTTDRIDYSGKCGVLMAGMWTASFLCSMYSMDYPVLGLAGNTVAILSVYALYLTLVRYRAFVSPLRFLSCCKMAWYTCLCGCMLTTLAQYLYFRFLDGGHLLATFTEMTHNEQYREMLKQAMPGKTPEELVQALGSVRLNDVTGVLLAFNMFFALPMSIATAMFASMKNVEKLRAKH